MITFVPAFKPVGTVVAVPSKSDVHRALICASLCPDETFVKVSELCADTGATVECLRALGGRVDRAEGGFSVSGPMFGGGVPDCRESGSTLRFLLPVAAALGKPAKFVGSGKLPLRPMNVLVEALRGKGLKADRDFLPISISGGISGGQYELPANISSQFISGLMMALPLTGEECVVNLTTKPESELYIEMTRNTLRRFKVCWERTVSEETGLVSYRFSGGKYISPGKYEAEGDWSGAAFFAVMGALGGKVTLTGLNFDSLQPDRKIIEIVEKAGADVNISGGELTVSRKILNPINVDVSGCPDLFPVLAVLACGAKGESLLYNAARLRIKESDRIETTAQLIRSLGGKAETGSDWLKIYGNGKLCGGEADGANDHRIVMSAAVAAVISETGVLVKGSEAVGKSYGGFFEAIKNCGACPAGKDV